MRNYELTYLSSLDISEKIKSFIREEQGLLEKATEPSLKKPAPNAFSIAEAGEGVFLASLEFSLNPEKLKNLEKKLKAERQILRYMLLIKKKVKETPPQPPRPPQPPQIKKVELKEIDQKIEEILGE